MKLNKNATSIVEAMVLMMIVVTGVTGMYKVYMSSVKLERSTNNKVIAINIAREGIEAITNIRDTNWILFSSDIPNCWNTFNYDSNCVGDSGGEYIENGKTYKIYKNTQDRWSLSGSINTLGYTNSGYTNEHRVGIDSNGFYTQTGIIDNFTPLFTREIQINYKDINGVNGDSNDPKMQVTSLVQWKDNTSTVHHKVELVQILSNWKE